MFLVITYDVTDDRRRKEIASELKNYGQRVQKSVFECFLEKDQINELKARIEKLLDLGEDSVRYYHLCEKDENNMELIGNSIIYRDEDYFMI
uniref:CRISPR-associated endoribonuclease Cas2 n=1 Tax=Dictyoglomus turgidum TaxID=513050 RepID=A0A7C3SMI1_9BACT